MIIDVNAYTGHWGSWPVVGDAASVVESLRSVGVDRIFLSPLDAAWSQNPHLSNPPIYEAARRFPEVLPVPVIDPTIATWRQELETAQCSPKVSLVKLLPAYSRYELERADELMNALSESGLGVIIQTRLEDSRRQHPLAQVPDFPTKVVGEVAERFPDLTVIIGGPRWAEIRALQDKLLALPNLYADVSQADGMDSLKVLVEAGLARKLLFGSHAPLFVPWSAMARVVMDLSDGDAGLVLGGNAERILRVV